jgi:hypothetical protein
VGVVSVVEWLDEPRVDGYGRITLGRWGGWLIDVCPMIFNDRLVLTPEVDENFYDYGWCYPKGGAAIIAARAWNPQVEGEPVGFIKATHRTPRRAGEVSQWGKE